jgi:uncharacterized damage-inducible protein DinB
MQDALKVPMTLVLRTLLICLLAPTAGAFAEDRPLNAFNKKAYGFLKKVVIASAEKMPAENYAFKPTEAVRSFGQLLGHVAESQYYFCSAVRGEKNPALKIEATKTSKAELVAVLKDAFAYCDKAHDGMTNAAAHQMVKVMKEDTPKLDVLTINNMHTVEHYGNIITYLRLKNIVPPSTEMMQSEAAKNVTPGAR